MNFLTYQIRHSTIYQYSGTVTDAEHVVKLRPRDLPHQRCLHYQVDFKDLNPSRSVFVDYFGNHATLAGIHEPHSRMEVTTEGRVAVGEVSYPDPLTTPAWECVVDQIRWEKNATTLETFDFIFDSPLVASFVEVLEYVSESFVSNRPVWDAALELNRRIHSDFLFDPVASTVSTPVHETFSRRRGVCQDFAHLLISCFRSMGLAARYVSGYLETEPPPGQVKWVGADASHAWVSLFCPGIGWLDLDPTNGCSATQRHITIGWGRDYSDICPLRGVINGGGHHQLTIGVDVIREDCYR